MHVAYESIQSLVAGTCPTSGEAGEVAYGKVEVQSRHSGGVQDFMTIVADESAKYRVVLKSSSVSIEA